ncbi:hypothetical protein HK107_12445 [Parvularcula sp. ZS-1/3]|uniref:Uncharacterized protein n=1 Tax=Parvularcula mediterranea TaxID=2732508 RepID=A0A7Y3RN38_9PROT|nr:hypothetical protein [Parvularcula mediterranea]NNU17132.1 hypothetical protein [Parvularcula mediterranea]
MTGRGAPQLLRIVAIVLALGLSTVVVLQGRGSLEGELPFWILAVPALMLLAAMLLAKHEREAKGGQDGKDETDTGNRG